MLNDATGFKAVYIVTGYTDLRSGMDRLAAVIESQTGNKPHVPDTLYLFCGRRAARIKGLVWEGDGWLLLYKRLSESSFQWPRNPDEVRLLTSQQFRWLMEGADDHPKEIRQAGGATRIHGMTIVQNREIFPLSRHLEKRSMRPCATGHKHPSVRFQRMTSTSGLVSRCRKQIRAQRPCPSSEAWAS